MCCVVGKVTKGSKREELQLVDEVRRTSQKLVSQFTKALSSSVCSLCRLDHQIRMKLMERAGYAKRGESDAGEEWTMIDEDGSDGTVDKMKEAVAE